MIFPHNNQSTVTMWVTVSIPCQRTNFDFLTMVEGGKWMTSFGKLEANILKADGMEWLELKTQNFVKTLIATAYELRDEWGDTHFPIKIMRWVRRMERDLGLPMSPSLKNRYLASITKSITKQHKK